MVKMLNPQNIFALVFICCSITTLLAEEKEEWLAVITMPRTESRAKLDDVVSGWNESSLMYPEEMSAYGDILLGFHVSKRGIVIRKWPSGTIPYIIEDTYSDAQYIMIIHAMSVIRLQTCVKFVPHTNEKDYLSIENTNGCKSYYGRFGGRQELYLQAPACVTNIRTVYHELLHAIGLIHEHCRSYRSTYVSLRCRNLGIRPENMTLAYAKSDLFVDDYSFDLPYDYRSVMHYTEYAGSRNGNKTIIPKDAHWIGRIGTKDQPSEIDIIRINKMYNCASGIYKSYPYQYS